MKDIDGYVTKDELYRLISRLKSKFDIAVDDKTCRVIVSAICDMPKTDVQPAGGWISVDDKLPEWDKTVLVWYTSDTLFGVSEGYGLSWYHGRWHLNDLNRENIRIFYWQYLPKPPKGDN